MEFRNIDKLFMFIFTSVSGGASMLYLLREWDIEGSFPKSVCLMLLAVSISWFSVSYFLSLFDNELYTEKDSQTTPLTPNSKHNSSYIEGVKHE